jgi:anti-sigma B factor antagonist
MKITTSVTQNRIVLLEVEGAVDAHTAFGLGETLTSFLAKGHSQFLLDASHTEYLSSTGLRLLIEAWREARQLGGEVRVFGANAQVRRVIELSGFEDLLYLGDTRQHALEDW